MGKINHKSAGILALMRNGFCCALVSALLAPQLCLANPLGSQVVNGQAAFATQGNTLSITASDRAIINWNSFSINDNETTRFLQPATGSAVLNRVTGNNPSAIYGALQSNGRVYLVNQNGIFIGPNATINVGSLVASTLNIADSDFRAGRINFNAGPLAGKAENQGTIRATGGSIYFIAPDVTNSGIISAANGDVLLAAGQSVSLVESATPEIAVVVSAPENKALNLGQIIAEAGRVGIYGGLVKQKGIVSADSAIADKSGRIFFKSTRETIVEAGSRTSADGIGMANGGSVMVLSEGFTGGEGAITARGGNLGGNGGFIETSGSAVDFSKIKIDASAVRGRAGLWLIDPQDLVIDSAGAAAISSALSGADVTVMTSSCAFGICSGTNGDITVGSGITKTSGGETTLTLKADRSIIVNAPIASSSGKLNVTLNSHYQDDNAPGSVGIHGNISTNGGHLVVGGGSDPALFPAIGYNPAGATNDELYGVNIETALINTVGGNISIRGQGVIASSTDSIGINMAGVTAALRAAGGNITLVGRSGNNPGSSTAGIYSAGIIDTTGTGFISVTGRGGQGTANMNRGVNLYRSVLQVEDGSLDIIGYGGDSTGNTNQGVLISGASGNLSQIKSTGSGAITITGGPCSSGCSNTPTKDNVGVDIKQYGSVSSEGGAITINGTGAGSGSGNAGVLLAGKIIANAAKANAPVIIAGIGSAGGSGITTTGTSVISTAGRDLQLTSPGGITISGPIASSGGASSSIFLKSDTLAMTGSINSGSSGLVSIITYDPGRPVTLGGGITTGSLGLSSGLLNSITTGSLTIGDAAHNGAISTDGDLDISGATGLVALKTSGGTVTLNHDVSTMGNLTINTKGAGSSANGAVTGTGSLSIGPDGLGTLSVIADGGIDLSGSGNAMAGFGASNSGIGDIRLVNTNPLTITGISQSGGSIMIGNSGAITIAGGINAGSGNISLTTLVDDIKLNAPISAPSGQVTLNAYGAITSNVNGALSGSSLEANASTGIGSTGYPIKTAVNSLSAINSISGDIVVSNTGTLNIQNLSGAPMVGNISIATSGAVTTGPTIVTSGGNISLAAKGPLTIGSGGVTSINGSIHMETVSGGSGVTTDNLTINGPLSAPGTSPPGNITLAAGNAIIENSTIFAGGTVTKSANLNPPPSCSTGYAWDGSACVPITCPTGQQLVGNICQAITCPTGQQLVGNICQAITCPIGQELVGNTCQVITCPIGQELVGNICQTITCPTGQQLFGNICQTITCPSGQQLIGNICQVITCPTGQQLIGNICQAIICPTGQQPVGSTCQAITCPTGQQLVGNICQVITCSTGQQLVGSSCQAIICPTGQQLVGSSCQAITCPTGQQLVGNSCQAITCPSGQQLVGSTCQAITCLNGERLAGNVCIPFIQQVIDAPLQKQVQSIFDSVDPALLNISVPTGSQGLNKPPVSDKSDTNHPGSVESRDEDTDRNTDKGKDVKNTGSTSGGAKSDVKPKKNYCN